ncbi:MAG TPA: T9SS type A sorting domain-containing protein, partial [Chitinophagaceae bacterium]|nr:T9SS type A sorting domain-containing protein [Chitinophagaceae bacterium]
GGTGGPNGFAAPGQPGGAGTLNTLNIGPKSNVTYSASIAPIVCFPLPVDFASFDVTKNNQTAVIDWVTTNEFNSASFDIERSTDALHFTTIGNVPAKNLAIENAYTFTDLYPVAGINYYRLKQIDKNGKFSYSNIVSVNPVTIAKNTVAVYPNPIVGSIMNIGLQSTQNTKAALMITDVTGRIVLHQQSSIIKGSQLIQVDVSRLSTGTYYLTVLFNNEKITQKISK